MSNDPYAPVLYLVAVAVVALLIDAIPDKPGRWGKGNASSADVDKIVRGGRPPAQPREPVKLGLLLLVVLALAFVLGGSS